MRTGLTGAATAYVAISGAITTAAGAVFGLTNNVAQSQAQQEEFSRRIGVSTEFLSEMAFAAEQEGIANTAMNTSLQRMQRRLGESAEGTGVALEAFKRLGIQVKDTEGRVRPLEKVFPEVAEALSKVQDPATKASLAMKLMDTEGVALLQVMDKGAKGLEEYADKAKELGIVVETQAAKASKEFTGNLTNLEKSVKGVQMAVANELIPVFTPMLRLLEDSINKWRENETNVKAFKEAAVFSVKAVLDVIEGLAITWTGVNQAFSKVSQVILKGFSLWLTALEKLLLVAGKAAEFLGFKDTAAQIKKAQEAVKNLSEEVDLMATAAGETAKEWGEATGKVGNAFDTMEGVIDDAMRGVKKTGEETAEVVKQGMTSAAVEAMGAWDTMGKDFNNTMQGMASSAKHWTDEFSDVVDDAMDDIGESFVTVTGVITKEMTDWRAINDRTFTGFADKAVASFNRMESGGKSSAREMLRVFARDVWPKIVAAGQESIDKYKGLFQQLKDNARDAGNGMAEGIKQGLNKISQDFDIMLTKFNSIKTSWGSTTTELIQDLERQVKQTENAMDNAYKFGNDTFAERDFRIREAVKGQSILVEKLLQQGVAAEKILSQLNIPAGFEKFFGARDLLESALQEAKAEQGGRATAGGLSRSSGGGSSPASGGPSRSKPSQAGGQPSGDSRNGGNVFVSITGNTKIDAQNAKEAVRILMSEINAAIDRGEIRGPLNPSVVIGQGYIGNTGF